MASFPHLLDQRRLIGPGGSTVAGELFFYYTGTSVLAPIYNDSGLTIPSENPISVGAGEIIPLVFLDGSITYRRVIVYSDGTRDEEDPLGNLFQESELSMPVGAIMDYAGATSPTGFLFCFGQEVSRTGLSDLFAAIGTQYGSGNGTTTFNLPDYRGRVGAGKDNMGGVPANRLTTAGAVNGLVLGASGGNQLHILTVDELAAHTHIATVTDPGHAHDYFASTGGVSALGYTPNSGGATQTTDSATTGITVSNAEEGSDEGHNNIQPTLILNKIIKTQPTTFFSLIATINSDKANASAIGIEPSASDMGVFTGSIISDNTTAKQALQELETTVDNIGVLLDETRSNFVVVDYFGEGLSVSDNWALAFQNAASAVGPGGIVYAPHRYTLDTEPFIPEGVTIKGPWTQPDEILPASAGDYDGRNGVIFLGTTGALSDGLNVNGSCAWEGLTIMRKGLDLPFASALEAAAGIAAFSGTAFNVAGPGTTFRNLLILGFNKAVYSGGFERTRCVGIRGDCTNGIDIRAAFDVPEVEDCEFWPYTTVHQTWTTNTLLRRSGTAFYSETVNDWMRFVRCFSYGYAKGFHGRDVNSVTWFLCGADNTSTAGVGDHTGSLGFVVDGACEDPRWISCQTAAQETGYFFANINGKHGTMAFCEAWGCSATGLTRRTGALTVIGGQVRDTPYGVQNEHGTEPMSIEGMRFNDIATRPIHSTVTASGVTIGTNDYGNWSSGVSPVSSVFVLPTIPSADPINLPASGDSFIISGTNNIGTINGGYAGRRLTLHFTGSLTVIDGGASLKLAGNLVTGGAATLRLEHNGVSWEEISRAIL